MGFTDVDVKSYVADERELYDTCKHHYKTYSNCQRS